MLAKK